MKKHYRLLLVMFLTVIAISAIAQETVVKGKVIDASEGTGLPGVNILEKGTSNGALTDMNGDFSIKTQKGSTLVFSFVGFVPQEVIVGDQTTIDISLQADATQLSEVVVIGYGEAKKEDLTGAIANISSKDFNKGVLTSPQDLLVGKIAGVAITSNSGAPGSGSTIRIRGGSSLSASNDPLIVIDGYPVSDNTAPGAPNGISNPLSALNPNDIESVTVLKDASATAIYGSRAANGVVIITTKKGAEGKIKLSYNGTVSVSEPIKYIDVMSGDEYRDLIDQLQATGNFGITDQAKTFLGTASTDWQREIFHNAVSHDHNLSASGSIGNLPYRISYGYTDQEGILKTTGVNRNSLNINLNPTFLDGNLKVNLSAKGSYTKSDFGDVAAVGNAISFDPTQVVRDETDESLADYDYYFSWLSKGVTNGNTNPVAMLEQTDNQGTAKRLIANAQIDYRLPFFKDLRAILNTGFDKAISDGFNRAPLDAGFVHNNGTLVGRDNTYSGENRSELLDFYFNYVKEVGLHKIDATAGYGWQHFYREGKNTDSNAVTTTSREFKNENFLVSFFGRLNYIYNGKYFLTATLREDGSSRFSGDNKWGLFPSVALAWRIKGEDFLSNVDALSDLKFRVGYGVTGQQDLYGVSDPYYPSIAQYRISNDLAQYQLGNTFYFTQRPQPYDANIKWEETTTYNIGIDFGLFTNRLTGSVELFQKNTKDLLNNVAIANGVNFSNYLTTNVGSMENKGVEVTLNALAVDKEDFTWNIGVNFTSIDSKITKINLTDDPTYLGVFVGNIGVDQFIQNNQIGFPAFSFFPYQQVYDADGRPIEGLYVDRSGDGAPVVGNSLNKYHYKRPAPDFLMGLNTRLNYKNIDFSFSSRLSVGNYVYNNVEAGYAYYNTAYTLQHFRNIPKSISNTEFVSQQQLSDYYVQNASFFKMDNMSVGYSFDNVLSEKLKARLSFTVQNAFIITDYKGIDPELGPAGEGVTQGFGIDNNIYPRPRTFLLGVNLTF
ncbi:MAG TPA: TonB-dependent receptor [Cyclobacteriaceae bacterium]|nr:TonB-dependent receptor [Cyclobacteriaceae bacterium]